MSKTWLFTRIAREQLAARDIDADVLDLRRLVADVDLRIHPRKSCASTAMALYHWPCSCHPSQSPRQTNHWMNDL